MSEGQCFVCVNDESAQRLVAVRYFLDRPGYGLHNATVRLWANPPTNITPDNVKDFLRKQGILSTDDILVEAYLDKFQAFMLLDTCRESKVEWDFSQTTIQNPGRLDIRLTDLSADNTGDQYKSKQSLSLAPAPPTQEQANTGPVGLFSFSMAIAMETMALMAELAPDASDVTVAPAWVVTRAPYTFFVGGILQFTVGIFQVLRGNIYGATAFLAFGAFLASDGALLILRLHFTTPDTIAYQYIGESDDWGWFIRHVYILAFVCALLKQTLIMNKLTTSLIAVLIVKLIVTCVAVWNDGIAWLQVGLGWFLSIFAFYVFFAEFTNETYKRDVFSVYKWSEDHSPDEVFGATGRIGGLHPRSTAMALRRARVAAVEAANDEAGASAEDTRTKLIPAPSSEQCA